MATKPKADTTAPHDDFKTMPSTMPTGDAAETPQPRPVVAEAPQPEPAPAKAEEKVIGWTPLSQDEIRRVNQIKTAFDGSITMLKILRDSYHDAEVQRMLSVAITHAESASMWAVRGVTHRG